MRKKAAEDKDAVEDKKANHGTKCRSWKDKGRNRKKAGKPNGRQTDKDGLWKSKWTVGISGCCSEACWFEAQSGMGPERKARARRLQKQRVIWETRETVPWKRSGCRQQAATRSRVRNAQSKVQNGNVTWSGYWKTTRG